MEEMYGAVVYSKNLIHKSLGGDAEASTGGPEIRQRGKHREGTHNSMFLITG